MHPAAPQMPGFPELFVIHAHRDSKVANGEFWHSDVSCDEEPPLGTMLQIHVLPEIGGDTLFANMYAAYDALSAPMQADARRADRASRIRARLPRPLRRSGRGGSRPGYPTATHPVIRTHPETGRKAIFVNRTFTTRINELSQAESDAVLDAPVRSLRTDRLPDPVPMGAERRRLLGQPLCDAPRHLGLLAKRAQRAARHDQRRSAEIGSPIMPPSLLPGPRQANRRSRSSLQNIFRAQHAESERPVGHSSNAIAIAVSESIVCPSFQRAVNRGSPNFIPCSAHLRL